jgi:hypothetical protein
MSRKRHSNIQTLHLDLPPEIGAQLQKQANANSVSLETLAGEILLGAASAEADSVTVESIQRDDGKREDIEIERIALTWPDRLNDKLAHDS